MIELSRCGFLNDFTFTLIVSTSNNLMIFLLPSPKISPELLKLSMILIISFCLDKYAELKFIGFFNFNYLSDVTITIF